MTASVAAAAALSLELAEPVPPEVPVGAQVALRAKVSGAARDLRGGRIEVVVDREIVAVTQLIAFHDDFNETATFTVMAPVRVGEFSWLIRFPPQEIDGIAYLESTLTVSSQATPHRTSLAIWSVPSPVRMRNRFAVMVGAKSSGACALGGAKVEVRDDTGAVVGEGILGETPWPGTDALYWSEIGLPGPTREGLQYWSVAFAAAELELAHLGSSAEFSLTAVRPPEHNVAIRVIESEAASPIAETQIALGPYRTATDETGLVMIEVPAGTYDLAVWKSGFEAASKTVEITADASIQFELNKLPKESTAWD